MAGDILAHLYRRLKELKRPDARIVAVSKTQPPEAIEAFIKAGQLEFGENRFNEARDKIAYLHQHSLSQRNSDSGKAVIYHHIGPLQSGNARQIPRIFSFIHGVSSMTGLQVLLEAALRQREREEKQLHCSKRWPIHYFFQVRLTDEESKVGGLEASQLRNIDVIPQNDALHFAGFMTMGPENQNQGEIREVFHQLRCLRDEIAPGKLLSMGMSADWEIALSEGADILRLGSLLFGSRKAGPWSPAK